MLAGKPRFAEIAAEFIDFINGAELIIHNASRRRFLELELALRGQLSSIEQVCSVLDTLARPAGRIRAANSPMPCKRRDRQFGADYHGALLTHSCRRRLSRDDRRPGQPAAGRGAGREQAADVAIRRVDRSGLTLAVRRATPEDLLEHERHLDLLDKASGGKALWRQTGQG